MKPEGYLPAIVEALNLAADGREEYAKSTGPQEWRDFMEGQAAAYRRAALVLEDGDIYGLITGEVPSWRWPKWVHERLDSTPHRRAQSTESQRQ